MTNLSIAVMQDDYPALTEMGITRFHEISHYTLRQTGASEDVLKVYYKRAKGSLLPESRKYRFGRSVRPLVTDSGMRTTQDHYEISPFLLKAVEELDAIAERIWTTEDAKERLHAELDELEELVSGRVAELHRQINRL